MSVVIWWPRRVLRLDDNPVLQAAMSYGLTVLPLYIFDPKLIRPQSVRGRFLLQAVSGLESDLRAAGAVLLTAYGDPALVLMELSQKVEIHQVVSEKDFTPFAKQEMEAIRKIVPLQLVQAITVFDAGEVTKPDGSAYQKYSAYRNRWLDLSLPGEKMNEKELPNFSPSPCKLSFPKIPPVEGSIQPITSKQAEKNLITFLQESSERYELLRNRVDLDETSHCSHYFRFGLLSPTKVFHEVNQLIGLEPLCGEKSGRQSWRDELIWREFFNHLMDGYVSEDARLLNRDGSEIAWLEDEAGLSAWQNGRTGYPLVDAAMRQLVQTGWMPGRARMVVASFLSKDLFIWWHWGERFFMKHLLDGDPAANHGNWQWVAGIGTDAAPFFRIFNPVTQSKKFDPHGTYIRTWLPELTRLPDAFLHEPWKMNLQDQITFKCQIGKDYPEPIVDHAAARFRALELFRTRRKAKEENGHD
jgi:deoxyribodipyrimidine photo-lyase